MKKNVNVPAPAPISGGAASVSAWASVVKKSTLSDKASVPTSTATAKQGPGYGTQTSGGSYESSPSLSANGRIDWTSDVPDFPPGLGLSPAFSPSGMSSSSENLDVVSPLSVPSALPIPGAGTALHHDGYGNGKKGSLTGSFSRMNLSNSDMDGLSAPVSITEYDPEEEEAAEAAEAEWPIKASAVIVTSGTITTLTNEALGLEGGEWEEGEDGIVPSYSWDAQPDPEDLEPICEHHGASCKKQTCKGMQNKLRSWQDEKRKKEAIKGVLGFICSVIGECTAN